MTTDRQRTYGTGCEFSGQKGQALSEWLMWAAVMTLAAMVLLSLVPIIRAVPAALAGWVASVGP